MFIIDKCKKGIIKLCGGLTSDIAPYYCNPYTWCAAQCVYCWARHYKNPKPPNFEKWIKFDMVNNIINELKEDDWKDNNVWIGSFADAYQPAERNENITRDLIKNLHDYGVEVTILTKYGLALRDLDLEPDHVGISLISLDDKWRRRYEPFADPAEERLKVMEQAHEIGLSTFVNIEPLLRLEDFERIYQRVLLCADKILLGKLNPRQKGTIDLEYPNYQSMMLKILKNYEDVHFKKNWVLK